jgi:acyl-CoA thioesterase-1
MYRILLLVLVLIAPGAAAAEPVVLVVGDSLSAGHGVALEEAWTSLLQERLAESGHPHRVVNASITGDTTRGGLARLPAALARHRPAVVLIELGGNDGLRGIPISEIRRNLAEMIQLSTASGAEVLLAGIHIPPNYGPRYAQSLHAVYQDLAQEYGTGLVPFILEGIALDPGLMQEDGIHPNSAAQPIMLDNVWPALTELLGGAKNETENEQRSGSERGDDGQDLAE